MMSSRYAPALVVLVALALVPTVIHGYMGLRVDDGLSAASIPMSLAGYAGAPTDRDEGWGKRRFESFDWFERTYSAPGDELLLTVVRTYDLKAVYHHPELAVAYGVPFAAHEVSRFQDSPDITVHVLRPDAGSQALGLYVLLYDGRYVEAPIPFQLRTSLELLVSGRKPMTLFFVLDTKAPATLTPAGSDAARLLIASIGAFSRSSSDAAR